MLRSVILGAGDRPPNISFRSSGCGIIIDLKKPNFTQEG